MLTGITFMILGNHLQMKSVFLLGIVILSCNILDSILKLIGKIINTKKDI